VMKPWFVVTAAVLLTIAAAPADADQSRNTLAVTSSNSTAGNSLLAFDATGTLVQTIATGGQGGVSGNAGGIAAAGRLVAIVNFGSQSVSLFELTPEGFALIDMVTMLSPPVSVAFGHGHLYVLGTTSVESHKLFGRTIEAASDGSTSLLAADASAAQVGVVGDQLLITEKSNVVEVVDLQAGAVTGTPTEVPIPAGSDTPLGLTTRGATGYVTIAHSDEVGIVKGGQLTALVGSGSQHAPCWLTLVGQYLYSSNSPSHSISRYVVSGTHIVLDAAVVATTAGAPTDIGSFGSVVAVLDGGTQTHLTQFVVDEDGNLEQIAVSIVNKGANGVVVVQP
jgi:hypothetical protein